ncbi:MAG: TolC family protein [Bacteroidales bacterium]|nr:TolC family protein [Bacteroidales bacterium]
MKYSSLSYLLTAVGLLGGTGAFAADKGDYMNFTPSEHWVVPEGTPAASEVDASNARWWETFDDQLLDSLITIGEQNNYNATMAARRINAARAAVGSARSAYYPQIGLSAGWNRTRTSGRMAGSEGAATTMSYFSGAATMNWEVDVFGKITAQVGKAKSQVKLSAAEYASVILALDAEIAETYIGLLVQKTQLEIARTHSESQEQTVHMTEVRYKTGLSSKLDVTQARTVYYSTVAQIPLLEAQIEASYNALAVLTGTPRAELPASVYQAKDIPSQYRLVDMGVPLDLLRRRPDIVEAQRSIEIAAADLGIAKKDYLPSLSIQATLGTDAHNFGDLFSRASIGYSIAPTLSWTLFDGFARKYNIVSAREAMESEVDAYNLTVMTAIEEVRNAMARYSAELRYIASINEVVENSHESLDKSVELYKDGLSSFTPVVDAQLDYLNYQNTLVSAKGQALTALIELYKALGGGWVE